MEKPRLFLFVGYPGAGKTTIAQVIAARTGAEHIWADLERKRMFGEPKHTVEENRILYDHLNKIADEMLTEGKSVIFDTNFNFFDDREHLRHIAKKNGAEAVLIWVTTDKEIAKKRAVHGPEVGPTRVFGHMSSQDFERIASHLQPPRQDEKVIKIDGAKLDPEAAVKLLDL
jgi:predicted kinase